MYGVFSLDFLTGTQLIYWLINADTLCIFKSFLFYLHCLLPSFAHRVLGEERMNMSQEHGDHDADAQQRNRSCQVTTRAHSWEKEENIDYKG